MSQGLTWIAARRMPLVALVALLALTVGMFTALSPASAFTFGPCTVNTADAPATNYLLAGDTCTLANSQDDVLTTSDGNIASLPDADADGTAAVQNQTVTAVEAGSATVTVETTTDGVTTDSTYKIEVLAAPTISITFEDTDSVVKAGTPVLTTITTRGFGADHRVDVSVPSIGLFFTAVESYDDNDDPDVQATLVDLTAPSQQIVYSAARGTYSGFAVNTTGGGSVDGLFATATLSTAGAPDGEYTVTATAATAAPGLRIVRRRQRRQP